MNSRRPRFNALLLALLAAFAGIGAGCTQVQVAPNTLGEFRMGELQVIADRGIGPVYEATKRGLKDANLFQTKDDRLVIEAEINARDKADTLVIIKLKEMSPNRTSVKIRYGVPGNLALAQQLYQSIQRQL